MRVNSKSTRVRGSRHGIAIVYALVIMTALIAFMSLGVDMARVHYSKGELETAADAAARYGASFLPSGTTAVKNACIATAAANTVDGSPLVLDPNTDIVIGTWNSSSKTFTPGGTSPDAVQVNAARAAANGIPLFFASVLGRSTCSIHATAVAILQTGSASTARIDGIMNPYLAGMPNGTYGGADVSGTAPTNAPYQVSGITLTAGQVLTFSVTGSAADDPVNINQNWDPDGQPGGIRTNDSGYLNGMSQLTTQQASLVGIFLDSSQPNLTAAPPALDMSSSTAMNYTSLSPELKQPFFIGDGKKSDGTVQQIVVPAGATRLFLGTHDNINWTNNSGYYLVTVNGAAAKIHSVK